MRGFGITMQRSRWLQLYSLIILKDIWQAKCIATDSMDVLHVRRERNMNETWKGLITSRYQDLYCNTYY